MNQKPRFSKVKETKEDIIFRGLGKYFWDNFDKTWKWNSPRRNRSKKLTTREFTDEDVN